MEQDGTVMVDGVPHHLSPMPAENSMVTRALQIIEQSQCLNQSVNSSSENPPATSISTHPSVNEDALLASSASSVMLPSMYDPPANPGGLAN